MIFNKQKDEKPFKEREKEKTVTGCSQTPQEAQQ